MGFDHIGVVDEGETRFVLEVSVLLVVGVGEDLHSVVLLGDLRVNQVNGEFGLVQSFDDSNVSESFGGFSADQNVGLELVLVQR
jgi:hypothetical protein